MSSDSGQWQAPTAGFLFIIKIGDFIHVLKPVNQKSADNLRLAQQAEANIDMARSLFTEHRDFLLAERQIKMDEIMSDTEEAINRVAKLLEPSRVEYVSEESVRFNIKNPWALTDDHKSAATFGRLQITNNKLKTVLHDLRNIVATAQLDSCETRVNSVINSGFSSPTSQDRSIPREAQDAAQSPAWRRSHAGQSIGSRASSTISLLSPNDLVSGNLGPLSGSTPSGTLLTNATGTVPPSPSMNHDSTQLQPTGSDNVSDAPTERLPIIHELEAVLYGSVGAASDPRQAPQHHGSVQAEGVSRTNTKSTNASSDVSSVGSPSARQRKSNHVKRESFADYRRKIREQQRQQELEREHEHDTKTATSDLLPSVSSQPFPRPAERYDRTQPVSYPAAPQPPFPSQNENAHIFVGTHQDSPRIQEAPIAGTTEANGHTTGSSAHTRPASAAAIVSSGVQLAHHDREHMARSAISPRLVFPSETQRQREQSTGHSLPESVSEPAQLISPHQIQSPQEQSRPPVSTPPETLYATNAEAYRALPASLRAARSMESEPQRKAQLPYPVSETGSDHPDEFSGTDFSGLRQVQSAVYQPVTAPTRPVPIPRTTYPSPGATHYRSNPMHDNSTAGAPIPAINVTRVHTISRKPLPSKSTIALPNSSHDTIQPVAPYSPQEQQKPHAPPLANGIQNPRNISIGPPSPAVSEDNTKQGQWENNHQRILSAQHLEPMVPELSRTSSVSAEEPYHAPQLVQPRSPVKNPLAMHPLPDQIEHTERTQPSAATESAPERQWPTTHMDYSSPAWRQASNLYPVFQQQSQHPGLPPQHQNSHSQSIQPPQPHPPVRTQTDPYPPSHDPAFSEDDQQPRRASDQGYLNTHPRPIDMYSQSPLARSQAIFSSQQNDHPIPAPPIGPPPPLSLSSEQQQQQQQQQHHPYLNQQQQQQQYSPPRNMNPPTSENHVQSATQVAAPGTMVSKPPPLPSQVLHMANMNGNNGYRKPSNDRELFGRGVLRNNNDGSPPQASQASQFQPQYRSPPEQHIPGPINNNSVPPQQRLPFRPPSQLQSPPTPPKSNQSYNTRASAEIPLDIPPAHPQQQEQWQYAMHRDRFNGTVDPPNLEVYDQTQPPVKKIRKKQSWLAHQAGKLSARQNRFSTGTNLTPIMDEDQMMRTQVGVDGVRYA